jgi:hypothetical protein
LTWVNTLEVDDLLLFLFTVTLVLATGTGHEVFLFSFAGKGLALWKLLACALIWLSDVELLGDLKLLLCDLGEILIVALGLDFRLAFLFWDGVGSGLWCPGFTIGVHRWWDGGVEAILLLFLGNRFASFLIGELGFSSLAAPSMASLLCVVALNCQ